jgi:hypothetical protein
MKKAARKIREWALLSGGAVLGLALVGGGEPIRGAVVAALGALGAALVSRAGRLPRRWPRLEKALGRMTVGEPSGARRGAAASLWRAAWPLLVDGRLEPALDAAEDALLALEGVDTMLAGVRQGVLDLARRALGLSHLRAGHEATLARIFLETRASELELQARAEHARLSAELEQIRGVLATIGPSVRHLSLVASAEQLDTGQAPAELEERVALLRAALHEELAHA